MKIVLSPAKSLNFEDVPATSYTGVSPFMTDSEKLVKKLQKCSAKKLSKMMDISSDLGLLNHDRFQKWETPFNVNNAKPALFVFSGEVYRGLDARSLSEDHIAAAQQHVRILSGLYGILKPLDLMQPYRLEMGTKFAITPKKKNLYQYWGDRITEELNTELREDDGILINAASKEYFSAIKPKKLDGRIIDTVFKNLKDGAYKQIPVYAKHARGLFARFLVQNDITKVDHLKAFDLENYRYDMSSSSEDELVFLRDKV